MTIYKIIVAISVIAACGYGVFRYMASPIKKLNYGEIAAFKEGAVLEFPAFDLLYTGNYKSEKAAGRG